MTVDAYAQHSFGSFNVILVGVTSGYVSLTHYNPAQQQEPSQMQRSTRINI